MKTIFTKKKEKNMFIYNVIHKNESAQKHF